MPAQHRGGGRPTGSHVARPHWIEAGRARRALLAALPGAAPAADGHSVVVPPVGRLARPGRGPAGAQQPSVDSPRASGRLQLIAPRSRLQLQQQPPSRCEQPNSCEQREHPKRREPDCVNARVAET